MGTLGSGKTTFARKAASIIKAQHIELDWLHWEPNWVEAPDDLFREQVKQSLQGDSWVADGNYQQVRDIVWDRANTIVWLDYPFKIIMGRLAKRTIRRILTRERLWNGNQEHFRNLLIKDSVFLGPSRPIEDGEDNIPSCFADPKTRTLLS